MSNTIIDIKNLSFMYKDLNDSSAWKMIFEDVNLSLCSKSKIS